ncbi:MAG TPA: WhiB family transcriptional regulator [Pseudonocardia sp.]|jgi:WhiB family redox-sensing transcriptional regulator
MSVDTITRAAGLNPDWRDDAACRGQFPELFFADKGRNDLVREARRICNGCPARAACLEWAMAFEGNAGRSGRWGMLGGLTGTERAELARARRASGGAA